MIYKTNVTNTDFGACGSSVFTMNKTIPAGWIGSFTSNSFVLNPGASQLVNFSITSTNGSSSGNYTFLNNATNTNSLLKGSVSAVYHVN